MLNKKIFIPLLVILLVLAAGIGVLYNKTGAEDVSPEKPVPVEVVPVKKGAIETWVAYSGTVQDEFSAVLSAKLSAEVRAVYAAEGDKVTAGTVLAELDHRDLDLKLETLEAKSDAAAVNANYLGNMLEKYALLLEEGAVSRQQHDEAELKHRLATAEVKTIEGNIKEVKAALDSHYIKAPRDGIVTGVLAEQGDMAMPGKALISFSGGETKKIVTSVVQEDLQYIKEGSPAAVTCNREKFETKVSRILPEVDPATSTAVVELFCEDRDLVPGTAVEVSFITHSKEDILLIPSEAVLNTPDGSFVYVVEKNTAVLTPVTVGVEDKGFIEVVSGLKEGQGAACGDLNLLKDNCSVYVVGGGTS